MKIKHIGIVFLAIVFILTACATQEAQKGVERFGRGVAGLILSPLMIVSGLAQGLAFLPYTLGTGVDSLNQALVQSQSVTLDDSYRAAYGVSLADSRVDRQTGQVSGQSFGFGQNRPEAMMDATKAFQRLLISQGMSPSKAENYVIVGDYTHTRTRGHILLAVVYRHNGAAPFRVMSKTTGIVTTLRPDNMGWLSAYERDINGQAIDEVIDWTGLDYQILQQDKVVAMLMVIAAESVKSGKRSPGYWTAEKRWIAGESSQVIAESSATVKKAMPNL